MPGASGPGTGSGDTLLPPVFTRWSSEPSPGAAAEPSAPFAAPVEVPSSEAAVAPDEVAPDADSPTGPEPDLPFDHGTRSDLYERSDDASADAGLEVTPLPELAPIGEVLPPEPARTGDAMLALADRLERFAERLRTERESALGAGLVGGDRFDALLTAFVSGFLAAGNDD